MLRTKGTQIIDEKGNPTPLRGVCLGTWMMMENMMLGYPGGEQQFRGFMRKHAGKEKADLFFDNLLDAFVQEEDIRFIKEMGCTGIRVPFNYRHFESDNEPFVYNEDGFKHLDRIVELCKKYNVYVILDMHSLPGYQNYSWHSDNITGSTRFYQEPIYQQRMKELWKHIADHYKNEDIVAGYDLINEPVAIGEYEVSILNKVYRETTKSIREIDKNHIIFLKGNLWGRSFEGFDAPFDDNLVYSCHFYTGPMGCTVSYPRFQGIANTESFTNQVSPQNRGFFNLVSSRSMLEQQMDARDEFAVKNNVPCWVGEFCLSEGNPLFKEDGMRLLEDQLKIFNERGHSWSYWSYKSILGGLVHPTDDSKWMNFVEKYRPLREKYNCDMDGETGDKWELGNVLKPFYYFDFRNSDIDVDCEIRQQLSLIFSKALADLFTKDLSKFSGEELKNLTSSFLYKNCGIRTDLKELIKTYLV